MLEPWEVALICELSGWSPIRAPADHPTPCAPASSLLCLAPPQISTHAGCTLAFLTCLFYISVYTYLPSHLSFLRRRFAYYVYGSENADILGEVACSVREGLGLAAGAAGTSWHMWDALRSKAGFGGGVAMRGEL